MICAVHVFMSVFSTFFLSTSLCDLVSLSTDKTVYAVVTVVGTLIPQVYMIYQGFTVLNFFIPMMGRVGTEEVPDVIVAIMTMIPVALVVPFQVRSREREEERGMDFQSV